MILVLSPVSVQKPTSARESEPEFVIRVEVHGPLAASPADSKQPNVAYIRYGAGFGQQTVLLKWPEENKGLTERIRKLQGKWVNVRGRMEIGIPPEVRVEKIEELATTPKE
jgi:hypothetical protein